MERLQSRHEGRKLSPIAPATAKSRQTGKLAIGLLTKLILSCITRISRRAAVCAALAGQCAGADSDRLLCEEVDTARSAATICTLQTLL